MVLSVSLAIENRGLLPGAQILATTTVTNHGEQKVVAHSTEAEVPLTYEFFSLSGPSVMRVSAADFHLKAYPWPPEPPAPLWLPLDPGQTVAYHDDIGQWFERALPVGEYECAVHYTTVAGEVVSSPRVRVDIGPLVPAHVAETTNADGERLESVVAVNTDSGFVILQRESVLRRPELGDFRVYHEAQSQNPCDSLALATDVGAPNPWRYIAWTEGQTLAAKVAWAGSVIRTIAPWPIDLAGPRLLPVGWQFFDGRGRFVVVGEQGGQTVALVVTMKGLSVDNAATYALPGAPLLPPVCGLWPDATEALGLVCAVQDGPVVRLGLCRLVPGKASSIQWIYSRPGVVRALALAPILNERAAVDAVFDLPPGKTGKAEGVYVRAPLDGGAAFEWTLPSPSGAKVDEFVLAAIPHAAAPVLARIGSDVWLSTPAAVDDAWAPFGRKLGATVPKRLIHLVPPNASSAGGMYVGCYDPDGGFLLTPWFGVTEAVGL